MGTTCPCPQVGVSSLASHAALAASSVIDIRGETTRFDAGATIGMVNADGSIATSDMAILLYTRCLLSRRRKRCKISFDQLR